MLHRPAGRIVRSRRPRDTPEIARTIRARKRSATDQGVSGGRRALVGRNDTLRETRVTPRPAGRALSPARGRRGAAATSSAARGVGAGTPRRGARGRSGAPPPRRPRASDRRAHRSSAPRGAGPRRPGGAGSTSSPPGRALAVARSSDAPDTPSEARIPWSGPHRAAPEGLGLQSTPAPLRVPGRDQAHPSGRGTSSACLASAPVTLDNRARGEIDIGGDALTEREMLEALREIDTPTITNVVATYPGNELCLGLYNPCTSSWSTGCRSRVRARSTGRWPRRW